MNKRRKNWVHFQKGLSLDDFTERYGTDEACRDALAASRWPDGFECPACGRREHCVLSRRALYQCNACRTQTSVTAGTIFHATKLPLRKWFLAMFLISKAKNGISSLELARDLGVRQTTAWMLKHKLMQVMLERENETILAGRVEADDAYLGGELQGGKPGRGSENKVPFIAAVETDDQRHPLRVQFQKLASFTKDEVKRWAATRFEMQSLIVTDGLACFGAVKEVYSKHKTVYVADKRKAGKHPSFKWVSTVLGNVKSALRGTYIAIRQKHVPRYLAEFQYRFNRRFHLASLLSRLLHAAARAVPMPYRLLTMAESAWPADADATLAEAHG